MRRACSCSIDPAGDLLEARPPERPDLGPVAEVLERRPAEVEQAGQGVGRQIARIGLDEALEHAVDDDPALERAGVGVERLERPEPEDAPGVEGVGVAHPERRRR